MEAMQARVKAARERLSAKYRGQARPWTSETESSVKARIAVAKPRVAEAKKRAQCPVAVKGYTRDPPKGPVAVQGYCRKAQGPPTHWKGQRMKVVSGVRG